MSKYLIRKDISHSRRSFLSDGERHNRRDYRRDFYKKKKKKRKKFKIFILRKRQSMSGGSTEGEADSLGFAGIMT